PTPQQTPVRQCAVVVEGEAAVVNSCAGAQAIVQSIAKRLGYHHVGGDRQDGAIDRLLQASQIATAGQHHLIGQQLTLRGAQAPLQAFAREAQGATVFVDSYTLRSRRRSE